MRLWCLPRLTMTYTEALRTKTRLQQHQLFRFGSVLKFYPPAREASFTTQYFAMAVCAHRECMMFQPRLCRWKTQARCLTMRYSKQEAKRGFGLLIRVALFA